MKNRQRLVQQRQQKLHTVAERIGRDSARTAQKLAEQEAEMRVRLQNRDASSGKRGGTSASCSQLQGHSFSVTSRYRAPCCCKQKGNALRNTLCIDRTKKEVRFVFTDRQSQSLCLSHNHYYAQRTSVTWQSFPCHPCYLHLLVRSQHQNLGHRYHRAHPISNFDKNKNNL